MELKFYNFNKNVNSAKVLPSALAAGLTLTGNFEIESSLINPSVLIANTNALSINGYNYFSLTFSTAPTTRYYFIRDIIAMPDGRVKVIGVEDALGTFRTNVNNSYLHVVRTNNVALINKTLYNPMIQMPLNADVAIVHKEHTTINSVMSNTDGYFIAGIAMREKSSVDHSFKDSRPHATVVMSGIGYYLFTYFGFTALMSKLQELQAQDSDYNIKDKIVNIRYLPIVASKLTHDSSTSDDLSFDLGTLNGTPYVIDIPQTVNGNVCYIKLTSGTGSAVLDKTNIILTENLPVVNTDLANEIAAETGLIAAAAYNFEPYQTIQIMFGPFGVLDITAKDWISPNMSYLNNASDAFSMIHDYELTIDLITGAAKLRIRVGIIDNDVLLDQYHFDILAESNLQLCPNIPYYGLDSISQTNLDQIKDKTALGILGGFTGIMGGLASKNPTVALGGVGAILASGISYDNMVNKEMIQSGYVVGNSSGSFLDFGMYTAKYEVIVTKKHIAYFVGRTASNNEQKATILPCDTSIVGFSITSAAFIQCDYVELNANNMTEAEQDVVKHYLMTGCIIE